MLYFWGGMGWGFLLVLLDAFRVFGFCAIIGFFDAF